MHDEASREEQIAEISNELARLTVAMKNAKTYGEAWTLAIEKSRKKRELASLECSIRTKFRRSFPSLDKLPFSFLFLLWVRNYAQNPLLLLLHPERKSCPQLGMSFFRG